MRFKDLPKEIKNLDGEVSGILQYGGQREEFEHRGKKVMVKRLYYKGVGVMEGQDFTTCDSDTLWLAYFAEAWIQQGGKLTELKNWAGLYKNYKFNRPGAYLKARARKFPNHYPSLQGRKKRREKKKLGGNK